MKSFKQESLTLRKKTLLKLNVIALSSIKGGNSPKTVKTVSDEK
jgi:hypothetical protein